MTVGFNYDNPYDVAELEGYAPRELEAYCKECLMFFIKANRNN